MHSCTAGTRLILPDPLHPLQPYVRVPTKSSLTRTVVNPRNLYVVEMSAPVVSRTSKARVSHLTDTCTPCERLRTANPPGVISAKLSSDSCTCAASLAGCRNPALHLQLLEVVLPASDGASAGQLVHTEEPAVAEYLPAMQTVHASLPRAALYFPATHAKHVPPSGPQYPASQLQAVAAVCPITECPEFALQAVQAAEPLSGLYVSAAHAEHRSPYAPV